MSAASSTLSIIYWLGSHADELPALSAAGLSLARIDAKTTPEVIDECWDDFKRFGDLLKPIAKDFPLFAPGGSAGVSALSVAAQLSDENFQARLSALPDDELTDDDLLFLVGARSCDDATQAQALGLFGRRRQQPAAPADPAAPGAPAPADPNAGAPVVRQPRFTGERLKQLVPLVMKWLPVLWPLFTGGQPFPIQLPSL